MPDIIIRKRKKIIEKPKDKPIIISKFLLNLLFNPETKQSKNIKNPADAIALYIFYCHANKNNIKPTLLYTSQRLKWTEERVRKNKKILIGLGLIKNIIEIDENKKIQRIVGHHIFTK